ncbi:MAG: hypothetical protein DLM57_15605 [Pseudonocardiales bacterium]|nr:MAG: hypothetical protein DLM57_15605 [Pseudonocardiales bacterium]
MIRISRRRSGTVAVAAAFVAVLGGGLIAAPANAATPHAQPASAHAGLPAAMITLGDSAISGEGAGTDTHDAYDPGTDQGGDKHPTVPVNYCHRSHRTEIYDTGLGLTALNVACSGADTGDLVSDPAFLAVNGPGSGDFGEPKQDAQLKVLATQYDIKMVVVQIGANDDFNFEPLVFDCINNFLSGPGCRNDIGTPEIQRRVAVVKPKITNVLSDLRNTMRADGYADGDYQLVLQSYFTPVTPDVRNDDVFSQVNDGCPITVEDLAWAHDLVVPALDDGMRQVAESVPGVRFLDQRRVTYGKEVCARSANSSNEYANGDVIDYSEQARNGCDQEITLPWYVTVVTGTLCENMVRQTYHPRVAGYTAEGACLAGFFQQPAMTEGYCTADRTGAAELDPLTPGADWTDRLRDGRWLRITAPGTTQALDIAGATHSGDDQDGRLLQMSHVAGVVNQEFVANLRSDGNYTLNIGGNHAMCLDATTSTAKAGVQSHQWGCNGKAWQRWNVRPAGNGYYEIYTAVKSSMVLTRAGGSVTDHTAVVLEPDTHSAAQLWKLSELGIDRFGAN